MSVPERLSRLPVLERAADRWTLIVAIVLGGAMLLAEAFESRYFANAEAGNVARAIASGRGFADAFFEGQGPTAHLLPVAPFIAGEFYKLFGFHGSGQAALAIWAVGVTGASFGLAAFCCRLMGTSLRTSVLAFAFLCLVPIHSFTEAVRWQVWDGGLATLLGLASLVLVLQGEHERRPPRFILLKAALPAATFLVNPMVGLAAIAVSALSTLRHRAREGIVRPMVLLAVCLVAMLTPWVIRNQLVLKHTILLRDNLGLELALANYPGALLADHATATKERLQEIHPWDNPSAQRAMEASGGEFAYSQKLLGSTLEWMKNNPNAVAGIWIRHLSETLFPPSEIFEREHESFVPHVRAIVASIVNFVAILSLIAAAIRGDRIYAYPGVFIAVILFLGLPFLPILRYSWVTYPLAACLAIDFAARLFAARTKGTGLVPVISAGSGEEAN
jgi:hypothetical protein